MGLLVIDALEDTSTFRTIRFRTSSNTVLQNGKWRYENLPSPHHCIPVSPTVWKPSLVKGCPCPIPLPSNHKWFGLEETFKTCLVQPCNVQGHLRLDPGCHLPREHKINALEMCCSGHRSRLGMESTTSNTSQPTLGQHLLEPEDQRCLHTNSSWAEHCESHSTTELGWENPVFSLHAENYGTAFGFLRCALGNGWTCKVSLGTAKSNPASKASAHQDPQDRA